MGRWPLLFTTAKVGVPMAIYRIKLDNRAGQVFDVYDDEPILDCLEEHGLKLPVACRYGGCVTCAARLISGAVDQSEGVALKPRQIADGYVLLCIARPLSDCVFEVGVESQRELYRNPFKVGSAKSSALSEINQTDG